MCQSSPTEYNVMRPMSVQARPTNNASHGIPTRRKAVRTFFSRVVSGRTALPTSSKAANRSNRPTAPIAIRTPAAQTLQMSTGPDSPRLVTSEIDQAVRISSISAQ